MATEQELQAKIDELESKIGELNHEAKSHRLNAKKFENQLKLFKEAGLDPDKDVSDQLETIKESASKGKKDESEFAPLLKKLEKMEKQLADSEARATQADSVAKIEKARSAFAAQSKDHFNDPDTVVDLAIAKGLVVLDDSGNPGIKDGDDFIPLHADKGKNAIDHLKTLYPKQAITKQVPGGKDTKSQGSRGGSNDKQKSIEEFDAMTPAQQMQFATTGGEVLTQ